MPSLCHCPRSSGHHGCRWDPAGRWQGGGPSTPLATLHPAGVVAGSPAYRTPFERLLSQFSQEQSSASSTLHAWEKSTAEALGRQEPRVTTAGRATTGPGFPGGPAKASPSMPGGCRQPSALRACPWAHAQPGAGAHAGDRWPAVPGSGVPGGQGAGRGRAPGFMWAPPPPGH